MVASRGDRIRCTVMFEDVKEKEDGKKQVPICFTLNSKRIVIEGREENEETDRVFMDYDDDEPLYPYVSMADDCSLLAKMCMRENAEHEISKNEDLARKVTKIDESLEETNRKLDLICPRENAEHGISNNEDLTTVTKKVTKIEESLMCMRENAEHEISKNEDLARKVTKIDESLEETNRKLDLICSRENKEERTRKVAKLEECLEETNRKLDTLLARLTQQQQSI